MVSRRSRYVVDSLRVGGSDSESDDSKVVVGVAVKFHGMKDFVTVNSILCLSNFSEREWDGEAVTVNDSEGVNGTESVGVGVEGSVAEGVWVSVELGVPSVTVNVQVLDPVAGGVMVGVNVDDNVSPLVIEAE
jgi:hypothetical protein